MRFEKFIKFNGSNHCLSKQKMISSIADLNERVKERIKRKKKY